MAIFITKLTDYNLSSEEEESDSEKSFMIEYDSDGNTIESENDSRWDKSSSGSFEEERKSGELEIDFSECDFEAFDFEIPPIYSESKETILDSDIYGESYAKDHSKKESDSNSDSEERNCNEDNEDDKSFVSEDISTSYDFCDILSIYELYISEDSDFYNYLRDSFEQEIDDNSPCYFLYKIYHAMFSDRPDLLACEDIYMMMGFIFGFVWNLFPYVTAEELDIIFEKSDFTLFKIFSENCDCEENKTHMFFSELLTCEKFHRVKLECILGTYKSFLNPDLFKIYICIDADEYNNEDLFEFMKELFLSKVDDFDEEHFDLLKEPDVSEYILELLD